MRRFSVVLNVKRNFVAVASQILPAHVQNLASLTHFLLYVMKRPLAGTTTSYPGKQFHDTEDLLYLKR